MSDKPSISLVLAVIMLFVLTPISIKYGYSFAQELNTNHKDCIFSDAMIEQVKLKEQSINGEILETLRGKTCNEALNLIQEHMKPQEQDKDGWL